MGKVKKNTFFVGIGHVLRLLMAFILLPISSRILGAEEFGRFNLATTVMFFIALFDDWGLGSWITREVAKDRNRAQRLFAFAVGLKIVLILLGLLFLAILFPLTQYDSQTIKAILILALYAVIISFRDLGIAYFRAYEEMGWESLSLGIEKVLTTVLGVAVLLLGGDLVMLCWVYTISAMISLCYTAYVLFPRFVRPACAFSLIEFKTMLKQAIAFGISLFLTTMYGRIDMMILSVIKGPHVWGWYSAAHKLLDFTNVVPTVLMIATFPALARAYVHDKNQLNSLFTRGLKYLLILAVPMIPGIWLLAEPIILLVYGSEYFAAAQTLRLFGITAAILFINIYAAGVFGATNNQGKLVSIQIGGLVLNIVLNLLLIPKYAHNGAALANVFTEATILAITLILAFTKIVKLTERRFVIEIAGAALIMSVMVWLLRGLNLYMVIAVSIILYFSVLFSLKTIRLQEIIHIGNLKAKFDRG